VAKVVEELVVLLPILEKEENENGSAGGLLPLWRKRRSSQWRGISVVERVAVKPAVTVVGSLRAQWRERVKRERLVAEKLGRMLFFFKVWTQFSPPSGHEMQPYL
jgi:hypothetical protein